MAKEHPETKLKKWRVKARKTQQECADEVGVTRQTWLEWEHGRRVPNSVSTRKIRLLTGGTISADDLYPPICEAV